LEVVVPAVRTPSPCVPALAHEPRDLRLARRGYGGFFLLMAGVNVALAARDLGLYAGFADEALLPWYAVGYRALVSGNVEVLVPALIAFEVVVGVTLWAARGSALRAALWAAVAFQLALIPANRYAATNLLLVLVPLGLRWWHRAATGVSRRVPPVDRAGG
jgi:hypothetical protein